MATEASRFDVQPTVANHFAWMRTMLGLQRTLMAAVRTSVSLIGFGFTVAQFFDKMRDKVPNSMSGFGEDIPRNLGLILIGAGVISLMMFLWQYRASVEHLKSGDYAVIASTEKTLHKPTNLVAFAVIIIGIAAFASVFMRF
jgi:inner membrane protein YidH